VPGTAGTAHLVHGGHDPAVVLAEGADLGYLPGSIVGEAKLHKLALQGQGKRLGVSPAQPGRSRK
jgi:hypothetical protein